MTGWYSDMSRSIIQNDQIKRCYFTHEYRSRDGRPLEKHHVMNGSLRDWAEKEGLWIWVDAGIHDRLHDDWFGVLVQKRLLKQIAQEAYEREHTRKEWMSVVHKNYII